MTNQQAISHLENMKWLKGYDNTSVNGVPLTDIIDDIITLLREQEPVTIKPSYFDYICSGCESEIDGEFIDCTGGKIKFCPYCGKPVKWND